MVASMTAFSRVQRQIGSTLLCWELKSVNHRYFEPVFRLPASYRSLEMALRQSLSRCVFRGKLECQLNCEVLPETSSSISINEPLVAALVDASKQIAREHTLAQDVTTSTLLAWPGAIREDLEDKAIIQQEVEQLFQEAVVALVATRKTEGDALGVLIRSRLKQLQKELEGAATQAKRMLTENEDKLLSRLNAISLEWPSARVEQEIAQLLTRLDVSEEIDRLYHYCHEVERVLNQHEPIGRRLDFLMQELHREANTLSAKSNAVLLTQHAIEIKVLIEQMREQIQNIE